MKITLQKLREIVLEALYKFDPSESDGDMKNFGFQTLTIGRYHGTMNALESSKLIAKLDSIEHAFRNRLMGKIHIIRKFKAEQLVAPQNKIAPRRIKATRAILHSTSFNVEHRENGALTGLPVVIRFDGYNILMEGNHRAVVMAYESGIVKAYFIDWDAEYV